jgi:hypothetical protein
MDDNTLSAVKSICITFAATTTFALISIYFQDLIKANLFGKIRCGACQGSGRVCTRTSDWPAMREYEPCVTCGSVGYLPFKTGGDK